VSRGHQTDIPAEQPEAQAAPRFPFAHGHQEWPEGSAAPSRQGPPETERLISAPDSSGDSKKSSNVNDAPIALARLSVRREYLFVADGETDRRRLVVVQARRRPIPREAAGEGFTATKKVGNSVVRNRARRRLREISRQRLPLMGLPGVDYVFIARQETAECPWARLLDDVETALLSLRRRFAAGEDVAAPRGRPRPNPKA
jgi:ribonuclease P protein component